MRLNEERLRYQDKNQVMKGLKGREWDRHVEMRGMRFRMPSLPRPLLASSLPVARRFSDRIVTGPDLNMSSAS
jgi:hypothetical protein